jgi:hypothetical protein
MNYEGRRRISVRKKKISRNILFSPLGSQDEVERVVDAWEKSEEGWTVRNDRCGDVAIVIFTCGIKEVYYLNRGAQQAIGNVTSNWTQEFFLCWLDTTSWCH